jgi:hypothetical protein
LESLQSNISDELLGKDRLSRISEIKKIQNREPYSKHSVFVGRNKQIQINVYKIDISLPVYRLRNKRTFSQQNTYLAVNKDIGKDFFTDPESREALSAQHKLLLDISRSNEDKNHYETFKKTQYDESQPMIINSSGILINGNTRMSAIRQLYYENKSLYNNFSTILIGILPEDITADQENYIEQKLQLEKDLKIAYTWTSEALAIEDRVKNGESMEAVINSYEGRRKSTVEHPQSLIDSLRMARRYLKIVGSDNQYDILSNDQYAMWEWSKHFIGWEKKGNCQGQIDYLDKYVEDTIKNKEKDGGKVYLQIRETAKAIDKNLDKFIKTITPSDPIKKPIQKPETPENDDPFGELSLPSDGDHNGDVDVSDIPADGIKKKTDKIKKVLKEEEEREKNRSVIFEDINKSINDLDKFIRKINDDSNAFDKVEETINLIPKLISKLEELRDSLENKK